MNFPQYIHLRDLLVVDYLSFVISGCHNRQSLDAIEVLEEILRSLRITKDNMSNQSTELTTPEIEEILTVPVTIVYNKNIPAKSMVLDPGWFNRDRIKFED